MLYSTMLSLIVPVHWQLRWTMFNANLDLYIFASFTVTQSRQGKLNPVSRCHPMPDHTNE